MGLLMLLLCRPLFHGFVRIADAIGIPYETAGFGNDAAEIREEAGINQFHRIIVEN